jgi:hypothetical protein
MSATPAVIDYYHKQRLLTRLRSRFSVLLRRRMLQALPLKAGLRVLEVGVTPVEDLDDTNFFSLECQKAGCNVFVTSPEDCSTLAKKRGWQWIPFDDYLHTPSGAYDLVISAAVLEHVGESRQAKLDHLRALHRASRDHVVITTPNRFHWMEVHTKLPLIHWLPKTWHRTLLRGLGMNEWASPDHLDLMGWKEFQSLIREGFPKTMIQFRQFWFLGAPSNLMAQVKK